MEHKHSLSTQRIELFSDAVFAIIVTLLVLELKVPHLVEHATVTQTLDELILMGPKFISFVFSFLIICIFWVNHHQFFSIIKTTDRPFMWFNIFLLFWLCFVPFPTAFLGEYPTNLIAVMLFGFVLFAAAGSFSLLIYYSLFKRQLVDEHINLAERKYILKRSYLGVVLYGLSVILAPLSIYISIAIFIIVPVIYFIPQRLMFSK